MEIKHFSHQHPLVLLDDYKGEPVDCFACDRSISGPSYGCSPCNFFLHKSCAEQPVTIHHVTHPQHRLGLMHQNYRPVRCDGCKRSISGSFYGCFPCNFSLHTSCAMLPAEMDHPLHTEHKLFLLLSPPPYLNGSCVCSACLKRTQGFTYHCLRCRFDLHTVCATLPSTVATRRHQHPFTLLLKSASFSCDDCRTTAQGISYLCFTCQFWVDPNCALLPATTSTEYHPHPLMAVSISKLHNDKGIYCDICQTKIVKSGVSVFCCAECSFFAHIGCVTLLTQALSKEDTDEDQEPDPLSGRVYLESIGNLPRHVEEISLRENKRETNLKHFTHEDHSLTRGDELKCYRMCGITRGDGLKCDRMCGMCMRKIPSPFFGCTQCNFFLHELCAKLPRHKKYPLEPYHPLTLHPPAYFSCNNCNKSSYEFFYGCEDEDCNFKLDLRCGSLEDTLEHEGHKHTLYLVEERSSKECNACCNLCVGNTYVCVICDFYLEAKCAVLPLTAWHRYDKHRLTLVCHSDDDELGQFTCEPCDSERDPKPWFYECKPCRFTAHLECINGKY